jgi:hypothetical protein
MSDFDVRFVLWLIFRACMFNKGKMVRSPSACDINEELIARLIQEPSEGAREASLG